jgi:hypothetical protein
MKPPKLSQNTQKSLKTGGDASKPQETALKGPKTMKN